MDSVRLNFLKNDDEAQHIENKDFHTVPSIKKDLDMIQQQLIEEKVFEIINGRRHKAYPDHKPILQSVNWDNIYKWCKAKILEHINEF